MVGAGGAAGGSGVLGGAVSTGTSGVGAGAIVASTAGAIAALELIVWSLPVLERLFHATKAITNIPITAPRRIRLRRRRALAWAGLVRVGMARFAGADLAVLAAGATGGTVLRVGGGILGIRGAVGVCDAVGIVGGPDGALCAVGVVVLCGAVVGGGGVYTGVGVGVGASGLGGATVEVKKTGSASSSSFSAYHA